MKQEALLFSVCPRGPHGHWPRELSVAENLDVNIFYVTTRWAPRAGVRAAPTLPRNGPCSITAGVPWPGRETFGSLFLLDSLPLCPDVFSVGPTVLCCL